jgi:hypothetical protein
VEGSKTQEKSARGGDEVHLGPSFQQKGVPIATVSGKNLDDLGKMDKKSVFFPETVL